MYYTEDELKELSLKSFGTNVLISKKTSLYNPSNIEIGNNVRIDDFCVLSAGKDGISIGNNIHIGSFCLLVGAAKITLKNYNKEEICQLIKNIGFININLYSNWTMDKFENDKHSFIITGEKK